MRYLPLTDGDRAQMLDVIGAPSVGALFADVPEAARLTAPLDLPDHAGEIEVNRALSALAAKNLAAGQAVSFLGAGAYRHHVPAAVDHLIQRGEFLTSYLRRVAVELTGTHTRGMTVVDQRPPAGHDDPDGNVWHGHTLDHSAALAALLEAVEAHG